MKTNKETTRAFIVRFWIEPRELRDAEPIWRGMIERVEDKQRLYFDHLDQLNSYFARYLAEIGVNVDNVSK